jgi:hypothetical protein
MLRVFVTLSPLMYRQAVAIAVQGARRGLVDVTGWDRPKPRKNR